MDHDLNIKDQDLRNEVIRANVVTFLMSFISLMH